MLKELYRSATVIRVYPLTLGFVCAVLIAFIFLFYPHVVIKCFPGVFFGNTHTRIQWNILNIGSEAAPARRVYVLGGSQIIQGFPVSEQLQAAVDRRFDNTQILEAAFSGQSILDSFILLSTLPIDSQTYIFLQVSPSRVSAKARGMGRSHLLLDPSVALGRLHETGFDFIDADRTARVFREMFILMTRAFRPYDKLSTEARYLENPAKYVARLLPRPGLASTGGSEGQTEAVLFSDMDIIRVMQKYVHERGGHMYLFEMPRNILFPIGMPGWSPEDHEDEAVRGWLKGFYDKSRKKGAESDGFSNVFYRKVEESGVPFISFHTPLDYASTDYYDSVHLLSSGRDMFLPTFFDTLEAIFTGVYGIPNSTHLETVQ